MQDFADMAEAHEWTLRRLREMAGRLTEQAYLRASEAAGRNDGGQNDEAHARWMLVFDRMARGLRLSIALEARLSRERRRDATEIEGEIEGEASGVRPAPRWRRSSEASPAERAPGESAAERDVERDDDGLPEDAPLARRIDRLKAIIVGTGAAEPQPRPCRAEQGALDELRAERARRAGGDAPPDEPWDVLGDLERSFDDDPPWRGSG
jgi:hypothetical protein